MAATNNLAGYSSSAAITITLASLATSSTLVAGRSSAEVDNTSNKYLDDWLSAKITVGTTPTANTLIEVWVVAKKNDSTYHDTFDGTDKNVTVTSREILSQYAKLAAAIQVPAATSNVGEEMSASVLDVVRSLVMPAKYQLFVVHNTAVNLNSTGGNHVVDRKGYYTSSGN